MNIVSKEMVSFLLNGVYHIYTTQTLIRITTKISIGLNTQSLPLWHLISSNSTKFSVVIENAVGYSFLHKSLTRRSPGCLWSEHAKCYIFEIPPKKSFISPLFQKIRNMKCA